MGKKGSIKKDPWCPFCGQKVDKPVDATDRAMHEFPVGHCQCGAVYSSDATGHNVGAAIVETLIYACGNNSDLAWELMPEDDYLTGRLENYDEMTHQVVDIKNLDGRPVRGVLYFVRLHTQIADLSEKLKERKDTKAQDLSPEFAREELKHIEPAPAEGRKKLRANKKNVKEAVEKRDIDLLVTLCFDDKKTLRLAQRLLYNPDEQARWNVAQVIGLVCSRVATREPGQVSDLLHKLLGACVDSAATPWGMIETVGYIISGRADIFGAFTKYLLNQLGEPSTRIQALWALAEIAEKRPDLVRETPFYNLFRYLDHNNAAVRGNAARLLGRIKAAEVTMQLMSLAGDEEEFTLWVDGQPTLTTVGAEAKQAVALINGGDKNE